jgi:hypothetical protein
VLLTVRQFGDSHLDPASIFAAHRRDAGPERGACAWASLAGPVTRSVRSGTFLHGLSSIAYAVRMSSFPWKRIVIARLVFGTAFGYLEAAVVSYLRQLHEPARQRFYPGRTPSELFPLLSSINYTRPARTSSVRY